jgi:hypothetical protein
MDKTSRVEQTWHVLSEALLGIKYIRDDPYELAELVSACTYRAHEGWSVELKDDHPRDKDDEGKVVGRGMTLVITTEGYDSYHPERGRTYGVYHYFIVPAATYNRQAWQRWLFEQFVKVEVHEAAEHFVIRHTGPFVLADGSEVDYHDERPFAPTHGKGDDPYVVHEYASQSQKHTRYFDRASG